jgi:hypothetical protein
VKAAYEDRVTIVRRLILYAMIIGVAGVSTVPLILLSDGGARYTTLGIACGAISFAAVLRFGDWLTTPTKSSHWNAWWLWAIGGVVGVSLFRIEILAIVLAGALSGTVWAFLFRWVR